MAAKTYAQEAKTIMNKYKLRLGDKFDKGDSLAVAAMNAELEGLQKRQEETRALEQQKEGQFQEKAVQKFADGGKLTKRERSTLSDILSKSYDTPDGKVYAYGGGIINETMNQFGQAPTLDGLQPITSLGQYQEIQSDGVNLGNLETSGLNVNEPAGGQSFLDTITDVAGSNDTEDYKSKVPWVGAASDTIGNLLANKKLKNLPDEIDYSPMTANTVDFSRGRENIKRERNVSNRIIARAAKGSGSQSSLLAGTIAGATGTQRIAGQQLNASIENEDNINAQIKNQASQFNAQNKYKTDVFNTNMTRENEILNSERKSNQILGITDNITGYSRDLQKAKNYDQQVNMLMAENPNYDIEQEKETPFTKLFQITDDGKIVFRNTNDKIAK